MQDTFRNLSIGLVLASLLMYFLMVALDKSWVVPFTVMFTVPLVPGGRHSHALTSPGTALNVQSLLGIIFIVGIKVANTVLLSDFAQELRRHEGLSPTEAIRKAAAIRVRPVTMTALAAFVRDDPGRPGNRTGKRSQRSAGPCNFGRTARRRTGHPLRAALPVFAPGQGQALHRRRLRSAPPNSPSPDSGSARHVLRNSLTPSGVTSADNGASKIDGAKACLPLFSTNQARIQRDFGF